MTEYNEPKEFKKYKLSLFNDKLFTNLFFITFSSVGIVFITWPDFFIKKINSLFWFDAISLSSFIFKFDLKGFEYFFAHTTLFCIWSNAYK